MKALITGASSGIGRDIARYLGFLGWDLIITARNSESLSNLKSVLEKRYGISVKVIPMDLATDTAPFELYRKCKNEGVDMLVNNAGYGVFGKFTDTCLESELNMLKLNIRAVHILTKLFLKDFTAADKGIILNVASSAGFMPGPMFSSYYASKSYIVNLTVAIYEELRRAKSGVKICALCPGPVKTNFNKRAGVVFDINPVTSQFAAKCGVDNALKGNPIIIPGFKMKTAVWLARQTPLLLLNRITYHIQHRKIQ